MMHGRNNGKKLMAVRIVKHAFEIIHLLTGENPLQVRNMKLFDVNFIFYENIYMMKKILLIFNSDTSSEI